VTTRDWQTHLLPCLRVDVATAEETRFENLVLVVCDIRKVQMNRYIVNITLALCKIVFTLVIVTIETLTVCELFARIICELFTASPIGTKFHL
jgi:hypothetical protein